MNRCRLGNPRTEGASPVSTRGFPRRLLNTRVRFPPPPLTTPPPLVTDATVSLGERGALGLSRGTQPTSGVLYNRKGNAMTPERLEEIRKKRKEYPHLYASVYQELMDHIDTLTEQLAEKEDERGNLKAKLLVMEGELFEADLDSDLLREEKEYIENLRRREIEEASRVKMVVERLRGALERLKDFDPSTDYPIAEVRKIARDALAEQKEDDDG